MVFSPQGKSRTNKWTALFVAGMFVLLAAAAIIGGLVYREIRAMKVSEDDTGWALFQLGFEHQRLLLAAETGASPHELKLRGDIYLSRVFLLRDAPTLADVRDAMSGNLVPLFKSVQATEALLLRVETPDGRMALLQRLRADSQTVRELMLDMSRINRQIHSDERLARTQMLLFYLAALELLVLALICLGILVLWITRRLREAGRELSLQLATQSAILRSVDAAILGLSPEGWVLYSNAKAVEFLGPTAVKGAMLLGDADQGLLGEIKQLLEMKDRRGSDGALGLRKAHIATESGMRHFRLRKFGALSGDANGLAGASVIIAVADVTAEEEAALRREESDARIAEASRVLAFAAISGGIVHEISQPLAAIRNYIYALKVSLKLRSGSEEHLAVADHLSEEVDRAIEVVRNVRRMGPQDPQETGICDINEAIENSVRLVSLGSNPPPRITVRSEADNTIVNGSMPLIGQVIVNLLKNALSASAEAGRPGAEVTVNANDNWAEVAVADFGTGVSADAAKSLFQPFSKSARGGMGLGLAICQRIAGTLGGSLSWENRDTAGAVFKFTVPLAKEGNRP